MFSLALLFLLSSMLAPDESAAQVNQLIVYSAPHLGATEMSTDNGVSWHPAGPNIYDVASHSYQVIDVYVTNGLDTMYSKDLGVSWQVITRKDPSIHTIGGVKEISQSDKAIVKAVVSPNPTSGITKIRFTRSATFDVELISPSGRQEWNTKGLQTNSDNDLLFDLSAYSPGVYLIVFRDLRNDSCVVLKVAVKP